MGPDPGGLSRRGGAATQCAGVNRNSARESEAGRWAAPECPWRAAGVRRRTWRAAAPGAASSGPPASRRPAYVQAPPSGPNCAIRSRGTATWRPAGVDAEQGAWNPEGGGAGGASVEGFVWGRPRWGARRRRSLCNAACLFDPATLTPALDCLLANLAFSH